MKCEFLRTRREPIGATINQFGNRFDDADVLQAEAGLVSPGPGMDYMDGLAGQGGEGGGLTYNSAATGKARTIDPEHPAPKSVGG